MVSLECGGREGILAIEDHLHVRSSCIGLGLCRARIQHQTAPVGSYLGQRFSARSSRKLITGEVASDFASLASSDVYRTVRVLTVFPCRRKGNLQLLRSAVENVVRNAINYTPEGAEVEVSLLPADRAIPR